MRNSDGTTPEVLFSGTRNSYAGNHATLPGKAGRYMERIDKIRV